MALSQNRMARSAFGTRTGARTEAVTNTTVPVELDFCAGPA
jgi:hypothetical protein